ncbi:MAG: ABC transporter permease [Tissierellia bacterium]|nr:ABC transporter permease [Tissierellia bacterium]
MNRKLSLQYIVYELKILSANWYIPFFGIVFPIALTLLLGFSIFSEIPLKYLPEAKLKLMLTNVQIVILSIFLLGHGAIYSLELEKNIPLRLELFGIPKHVILQGKIIAQMIFCIIALILYFGLTYLFMGYRLPTLVGSAIVVLLIFILGVLSLLFAHGICNAIRKFNATYGVLMALYFSTLILSGGMGIRTSEMPQFIQVISKMIPFSYIGDDFTSLWLGKSIAWAPFIQSLIFYGLMGLLIVVLSFQRKRI